MADLFDILLAKNLAGGVQPQGEIEITENGEYDVTEYATASVDVPSPFPITVTFMNGTEEWAKVGVSGNGKIAPPIEPPIPEGYAQFGGWYDENTNIIFPYKPTENKIINAKFLTVGALKSNGNQYIDSGVVAHGVDIKFQYVARKSGLEEWFFGARDADGNNRFMLMRYSDGFLFTKGNAGPLEPITFDLLEHNVKYGSNVENGGCIYDGVQVATSNSGTPATRTAYLFGLHNYSSTVMPRSSVIIYYAKLYDANGELIRDFIPAKSTEQGHENELCMLDRVTNAFFYNAGTGSFEEVI